MNRGRHALSVRTTPGAHCASGVVVRALVAALAMCALGVGAAGCVIDMKFEPIGDDLSLAGEWTVNGATADALSCTNALVDTVAIVVYDGGTENEYPELEHACMDGRFDTFPRGVLSRGEYVMQWRAYAMDGNELTRSERQIVDARTLPIGGRVTLQPVDFRVPGP